jgi:thymidine kinase
MGSIEVICGGMFSGKTEELLRRMKRAKIARLETLLFKPEVDTRYDVSRVVSHSKLERPIKSLNSLPKEQKLSGSMKPNFLTIILLQSATNSQTAASA